MDCGTMFTSLPKLTRELAGKTAPLIVKVNPALPAAIEVGDKLVKVAGG